MVSIVGFMGISVGSSVLPAILYTLKITDTRNLGRLFFSAATAICISAFVGGVAFTVLPAEASYAIVAGVASGLLSSIATN